MKRVIGWWLGIGLQSLVLGIGLFLAICRLIALASDTSVFRYQGF